MSVRRSSRTNTARNANVSKAALSAVEEVWTRPAQWLQLPDVTGQQRLVGLHAIFPSANFVALSAAGNYTVDWGDGTTTNHNSGTVAYKEYNYADISSTNESILGYRQVIIQVYPQAGQNLTTLNLQQRHNQSGLNTSYAAAWLDITINGSSLTSLTIGANNGINFSFLKQVTIRDHAVTNMSSLFQNCRALVSVPWFNTASVTSMFRMFAGCVALQKPPALNTSALITSGASEMFNGCTALVSCPDMNLSGITVLNALFANCVNLLIAPSLNITSSCTSFTSVFSGCTNLLYVPVYNTSNVTNATQVFLNCVFLVNAPALDLSKVTNVVNLFSGCTALTTIPSYNLGAVTSGSFLNTFGACSSLSRFSATGMNQSFTVANCKLSATELNTMFGNLSNTGTGKTVTVTGNYGAATCDTSIATAKGWSVTV